MREQGKHAPPVMYIPQDEEDYYIRTGKLPKALAANSAQADLTGIRVPQRRDDDTYVDAEGNAMTCDDMADYFARLELQNKLLLRLNVLNAMHNMMHWQLNLLLYSYTSICCTTYWQR